MNFLVSTFWGSLDLIEINGCVGVYLVSEVNMVKCMEFDLLPIKSMNLYIVLVEFLVFTF